MQKKKISMNSLFYLFIPESFLSFRKDTRRSSFAGLTKMGGKNNKRPLRESAGNTLMPCHKVCWRSFSMWLHLFHQHIQQVRIFCCNPCSENLPNVSQRPVLPARHNLCISKQYLPFLKLLYLIYTFFET